VIASTRDRLHAFWAPMMMHDRPPAPGYRASSRDARVRKPPRPWPTKALDRGATEWMLAARMMAQSRQPHRRTSPRVSSTAVRSVLSIGLRAGAGAGDPAPAASESAGQCIVLWREATGFIRKGQRRFPRPWRLSCAILAG
jgi:hypothetical protein